MAQRFGDLSPRSEVLPNKAMKLTKLSAALLFGRQGRLVRRCRLVPALARMDAGTASQLIASVRPTHGASWRTSVVCVSTQADKDCAHCACGPRS